MFSSILLATGAWIAKHIQVQNDGSGVICYLGRRIILEYVEGQFPYWQEIA